MPSQYSACRSICWEFEKESGNIILFFFKVKSKSIHFYYAQYSNSYKSSGIMNFLKLSRKNI